MKSSCDIVQDLLPAYLENTCSEASRTYVESHLSDCETCRLLLEECRRSAESQDSTVPLPAAESVLRRTSLKLHRGAILTCLGITAIVLYWPLFLWAKLLADQGNYRYFSWSFWEVFSAGSVYIPILTALWLIVLLIHSVRKKTWRKNTAVMLILTLLLGAQFGYLHSRSDLMSVTSWTTVESIPDEYHIVISHGLEEGHETITLETTPTVTHLLRQDGSLYSFLYEYHKNSPDKGVLNDVWDAEG